MEGTGLQSREVQGVVFQNLLTVVTVHFGPSDEDKSIVCVCVCVSEWFTAAGTLCPRELETLGS